MKGQSENNGLKKKFEEFTYPAGASNWDVISSRLPSGSGNGLLAQKFANFTAQPSSHVWGNISAVIKPAHAKRPVAWWWAASAASLLAFIYLGYAVYNSANHQGQLVQEEINKSQQTEKEIPSENTGISQASDSSNSEGVTSEVYTESDVASGERLTNTSMAAGPQPAVKPLEIAETTTQVMSQNNTAKAIEKPTSAGEYGNPDHLAEIPINSAVAIPSAAGAMTRVSLRNPGVTAHMPPPVLAERKEDVALAKVSPQEKPLKSTGFYDGTETSSAQNLSLWAGSLLAFASADNQARMESTSFTGTASGIQNSTSDFVTNHFSPPIYYGMNGEVKFWNRMALGLGVGFLHMRTASTHHFDTGQRVVQHINGSYLSVPVYLKFNFIDKSNFAAYTSAGHGYDILIGQKISTETDQSMPPVVGNIPQDVQRGNQANLYTSLGMHFKFTRQFGIFAEGSLMHYYHMSNSNFFSQQTYWPALRFGLLVSFE